MTEFISIAQPFFKLIAILYVALALNASLWDKKQDAELKLLLAISFGILAL